MIYLDNAATSWPKPPEVLRAMQEAMNRYGANPGRSGHDMSLKAAEQVYRCRETAAAFFHAADPARVIFVQNCTMALNVVIQGLLKNGGRAVVSDLEHNAVMRPLYALSGTEDPCFDVATVYPGDPARTVASFRRRITPETRFILCLHASNVFGTVLPVGALGQLAHAHGIPLVVDAAQTAGVLDIDVQRDRIDYLCVAGHKGLYGPMGTGMLILGGNSELPPLITGGTGSASLDPAQPAEYPDRLESGTPNVVGICGLCAGMNWVTQRGVEAIGRSEIHWLCRVYDSLSRSRRVRLYTPRPVYGCSSSVLSFTVNGLTSEEVAARLNGKHVAVRAGLHCAPTAHRRFGTLPAGTVRIAPCAFTTMDQGRLFLQKLSECLQ